MLDTLQIHASVYWNAIDMKDLKPNEASFAVWCKLYDN